MDRRSFLKGAAVAVAATTLPFTLGRAKDIEEKKRTIEIDTEDGWKQIRMEYLKPGDVFRIKGTPYVEDGIWGIRVHQADETIQ